MKTYVTFGQDHHHEINGKVFGPNCVAVIDSKSAEAGRAKAFEIFGKRFCMEYPEEYFDHSSVAKWYLDGLVEVI